MTTADEIRGEMNEEGAEAERTERGTTGRGRRIGAETEGRTMTEEDTGWFIRKRRHFTVTHKGLKECVIIERIFKRQSLK